MVGKDGDLLDELFDQSLIEICDVGFLLGDEILQFLDPVHGFFPVMAVNLGLFFLIAESEISSAMDLDEHKTARMVKRCGSDAPCDYMIFDGNQRYVLNYVP